MHSAHEIQTIVEPHETKSHDAYVTIEIVDSKGKVSCIFSLAIHYLLLLLLLIMKLPRVRLLLFQIILQTLRTNQGSAPFQRHTHWDKCTYKLDHSDDPKWDRPFVFSVRLCEHTFAYFWGNLPRSARTDRTSAHFLLYARCVCDLRQKVPDDLDYHIKFKVYDRSKLIKSLHLGTLVTENIR